MKLLISNISEFIKSDFDLYRYLTSSFVLILLIVLNYQLDFEKRFILNHSGQFKQVLLYFIWYAIPYYLIVYVQIQGSTTSVFKSGRFLLISASAIIIISLNNSIYLPLLITRTLEIPDEIFNFSAYLLINTSALVLAILPFYVLSRIWKQSFISTFGLTFSIKPAQILISAFFIIMPLILIASFQSPFNLFYPFYKSGTAEAFLGLSTTSTFIIYELSNAAYYYSIELLFRSILLIALIPFLDKKAVLAMVVIYAAIHFGKPLAETVSSIFGGYVLGIIAYQYRHIIIGFLLHLTVAWTMDISTYIQRNN